MGELDAGRLDRRIVLRRYSVAFDDNNQPVITYTAMPQRSASWRRATANERVADAQVTDIFETRWASTIADLNPKDRLTYAGKDYDISEVTEIGRREGLLIRASARVDL